MSAFVVSGLLGNLLGYSFYYKGTKKAGASRAVPISRASLLVATLFALIVMGETLTIPHFFGILVLAFGVMIVGHEIESQDSQENWKLKPELLFPLGAMVCFGLSAPIGKIGLSEGTPVVVGLAIKFSTALVVLLGYSVWRKNSVFGPFQTEEKKFYLSAGVGLVLGNVFLFSALRVSRVVVAMPFYSLTPLFVLVFSYFYLKRLEKITKILLLGTIIVVEGGIIIGVFM